MNRCRLPRYLAPVLGLMLAAGIVRAGPVILVSDGSNLAEYDGANGAALGILVHGHTANPLTVGPDGNIYGGQGFFNPTVERFDGRTGADLGTFATNNSGGSYAFLHLGFGPDGNLYGFNLLGVSVDRYDGHTGQSLGAFAESSIATSGFAWGADGNLYVGDYYDAIHVHDGHTGQFLRSFAPGSEIIASGVAFGPDGLLYVGSNASHAILRYNPATGALLGTFATGLEPGDLEFGADGNLYAGDYNTNTVLRIDAQTGAILGTAAPFGPNFTIFTPSTASTPEPASVTLLLVSVGSILGWRRWHSRRTA